MVLRAKNITAKQFAEEIGIQPSGMSHILGGRNNPSLEFVSKVLRRYPEIDANWLVMGKGEMYNSASTPMATPLPTEPAAVAEPSLFDDEVEEEASAATVPSPEDEAEAPSTMKVSEEGVRYAPTYIASAPKSMDDDGREVVRMLLIYSDNTFSEYRPR